MATTEFSLGKEERLKSNQAIQNLLNNGRTFTAFPLKVYWDNSGDPRQKSPARMAVSVPRKKFRRAVDRNLLKRRIRESYRRNKRILYQPLLENDRKIFLLILYLSDEFLSFDALEIKLHELLEKLAQKIS
jgi:ribonuclease P protein component